MSTWGEVIKWESGLLDNGAKELLLARDEVYRYQDVVALGITGWLGSAANAAQSQKESLSDQLGRFADEIEAGRLALLNAAAGVEGVGAGVRAVNGYATQMHLKVSDGGTVSDALPPAMFASQEEADSATAERQRIVDQCVADMNAVLELAQRVDQDLEAQLAAVGAPFKVESQRDGWWDLAPIPGLIAAGQIATKGVGLFNRARTLGRFLGAASQPITDYAAYLRDTAAADDAIREFQFGKAGGGLLGRLVGARAASAIGKVALPLTVVTGLMDAATGGGYEGARGWATRGFGLAGAAGAGALLASSAGLIALGPVGLGIAGVAVLAYGAWSLGNLVWDHREDLAAAGRAVAKWTGDAVQAVSDGAGEVVNSTKDALNSAREWGQNKLAQAWRGALGFG